MKDPDQIEARRASLAVGFEQILRTQFVAGALLTRKRVLKRHGSGDRLFAASR